MERAIASGVFLGLGVVQCAMLGAAMFAAVVAIVVSGVVQAWCQLGSPSVLVATPYGRLLLGKGRPRGPLGGLAGLGRAGGSRRQRPPGSGGPPPGGRRDAGLGPGMPPFGGGWG